MGRIVLVTGVSHDLGGRFARTIAAEAGHQVVCAAQHVHGSQGFDRSYPLHRYFLASKQNALRLGGQAFHLTRLGALLAQG